MAEICYDDETLLRYRFETLEPGEVEAVASHLRTCSGCAMRYAELGQGLDIMAKQYDVADEFDDGLAARVLQRVQGLQADQAAAEARQEADQAVQAAQAERRAAEAALREAESAAQAAQQAAAAAAAAIARPAQSAADIADEPAAPSEPAIPALHRLEERKWISAYWGTSDTNRRARFYRLTTLGKNQLLAESSRWEALVRAVGRVMRPTMF